MSVVTLDTNKVMMWIAVDGYMSGKPLKLLDAAQYDPSTTQTHEWIIPFPPVHAHIFMAWPQSDDRLTTTGSAHHILPTESSISVGLHGFPSVLGLGISTYDFDMVSLHHRMKVMDVCRHITREGEGSRRQRKYDLHRKKFNLPGRILCL